MGKFTSFVSALTKKAESKKEIKKTEKASEDKKSSVKKVKKSK